MHQPRPFVGHRLRREWNLQLDSFWQCVQSFRNGNVSRRASDNLEQSDLLHGQHSLVLLVEKNTLK